MIREVCGRKNDGVKELFWNFFASICRVVSTVKSVQVTMNWACYEGGEGKDSIQNIGGGTCSLE
jgi:hypothetical protein